MQRLLLFRSTLRHRWYLDYERGPVLSDRGRIPQWRHHWFLLEIPFLRHSPARGPRSHFRFQLFLLQKTYPKTQKRAVRRQRFPDVAGERAVDNSNWYDRLLTFETWISGFIDITTWTLQCSSYRLTTVNCIHGKCILIFREPWTFDIQLFSATASFACQNVDSASGSLLKRLHYHSYKWSFSLVIRCFC